MQIAIDGPSGAGKSTIAREVAKKGQMIYVDTGAMYRALGLLSLQQEIHLETEADLKQKEAELTDLLENAEISLAYQEGVQKIFLNGEDVSERIRTQEVGERASKISTIKEIRREMVRRQQLLAAKESVVMDGRDIGTVVLPNADLKIFLTASAEVRGRRRYLELSAKGEPADLEQIIAEVKARDFRDENRAESPLKQAEDAILVDSSEMSIEQVVERIDTLCRRKFEKS